MTILSVKNLFHDKVRLTVTLVGIIFALVLIVIQFGLFLGFLETSGNIVDGSAWTCGSPRRGSRTSTRAAPSPSAAVTRCWRFPGVAKAEPYLLSFANWKLPSGRQGIGAGGGLRPGDRAGRARQPGEGSVDDLRGDDTVIIDQHYGPKLGIRADRRGSGDQRGTRARRRIHQRHAQLHHGALHLHLLQARPEVHEPGPAPKPSSSWCGWRRARTRRR